MTIAPSARLKVVLDLYDSKYLPTANKANLEEYVQSEQFLTDAKTVRVYSNCDQDDTKRILTQREPVHIKMNYKQDALFKIDQLKDLTGGYTTSVFSDKTALTKGGKRFCDAPNIVSVYSETPMWDFPDFEPKGDRRVACLSVASPLLDTQSQPHFGYYIQDGELNIARYKEAMTYVANTIMQAFVEHKTTAFGGKGIKRFVISSYVSLPPRDSLPDIEVDKAITIFKETLQQALESCSSEIGDIPVLIHTVTPLYSISSTKKQKIQTRSEDIRTLAEDGDFIAYAANPHSFPGNANEGYKSVECTLGSTTAILASQCMWINPEVIDKARFTPVESRGGCVIL